jgi:hypothetical protein
MFRHGFSEISKAAFATSTALYSRFLNTPVLQ